MKLINLPYWKTEETEIYTPGMTQRFASSQTVSGVKIIVPDVYNENDQANVTWNRLKYGAMPDLRDAMHQGMKINAIAFFDDGVIIKGVIPVQMSRSAVWEGRIFTCIVDDFEVTDEEKYQRRYKS